jgi:enterochelin esterase-like enzyme
VQDGTATTETDRTEPSRRSALLARLGCVTRRGPVQAALVLAAVLLLWRLSGGALTGWAVGLGMDEQRGALVASLLTVLAGSGAATLAGGRPSPARAGAVAGLVAIEVVPFLAGAARTGSTEGLATTAVPLGWLAQPLGMLLLGWIAVTAGAALGVLLRSDLLGLWARLRRGVRGWPPLLAGIALVVLVALPAATTALQDGSLTALYSYGTTPGGPQPAAGHHPRHVVTAVTGVAHAPAGHVDRLLVGGRHVEVYVPAAYAAHAGTAFPVVYFLHGYPSTETQWLSGAQLPGVLDQLIAGRVVPPLLAVLPDGNGQFTPDAEWGDTSRGDRVEAWLVGSTVPAIDARYRTLGARHRGIAGLSSGGFGAVNIATRHPGLFGWAASYSGYFTARRDLFKGPGGEQNSPAVTVAHLSAGQRMPLYIGVGTGDGRYLERNEGFATELRRMGWDPVSFDVVPGGHGWSAWRLELVHSLEWLGTLWPAPPERTTAPAPVD